MSEYFYFHPDKMSDLERCWVCWSYEIQLLYFPVFLLVLMCVSNADGNFCVKHKSVLKHHHESCLYQTDLTSTDWGSDWERETESGSKEKISILNLQNVKCCTRLFLFNKISWNRVVR